MLKPKDKVMAKITSIAPFGAFCLVDCDGQEVKGLIHISEFSDYFVKDITDFVKVDEEYEVEVISFLEDKNQVKLSFKNIRPELLKKNSDNLKETGNGFKNLKEKVDGEISKN